MNEDIFTITYLLAAALVYLKIKCEASKDEHKDFFYGHDKAVVRFAMCMSAALWPLCIGYVCISYSIDFFKFIYAKIFEI